MIEGKLFIMIK